MDLAAICDRMGAAGLGRQRTVVAIAGAPGSGRSTLAEALVARLNCGGADRAALLPMDGFHFDDLHLVPAGLRPRKGAPETCDTGGYAHALQRLRARDHPSGAVALFDHGIGIARACARPIPADVAIVLTEGNHLLPEHAPWADLASLFDLTIFLDVPERELERRLFARWRDHDLTDRKARETALGNKTPDARLVATSSRPAPITLTQENAAR